MVKKNVLCLFISAIILMPSAAFSQALFSPAGVEIPLNLLTSTAVADFNEDGQPDIVTLRDDAYSTDLSVLLMQPSGWYATIEIMDIDGHSVRAADFNGDEHYDILVNDIDHDRIHILFGDGTGSFNDPITTDIADWGIDGYYPFLCGIDDFNDDGYADLVYGDEEKVLCLLGNGNGTFAVSGVFSLFTFTIDGSAVTGDFNNDGSPDIALPSICDPSEPDSVVIYLNSGSGNFADSNVYEVGYIPLDMDVGDFDNDGNLDIVSANILNFYLLFPDSTSDSLNTISLQNTETLSFLKGNGDGTFQPVVGIELTDTLGILHPVDFNNDGNLDLAVSDGFFHSRLGIMLGDGSCGFTDPVWHDLPSIYFMSDRDDFTSSDLNGDGFEDILFPRFGYGLQIFYNNGDGTVGAAIQYEVDSNPYFAVPADFNNDLYDDLAVSCGPGNTVTVLLNDGSGQLDGGSASYALPGMPKTIRAADLNNDNASDLIIADSTNISIVTLLGDGSGGFGSPQSYPLDVDSIVIDFQIGDFDEDGAADVVAITSRDLIVLLGDGSGSFSDTLVHNFGVLTGIKEVHLADFNEDNHIDLALLTLIYGPKITLLSGSGDGRFGNQYDRSIYDFNTKIFVADVNNDNHQDVVTGGSGTAQVWSGDGTGDLNILGSFSPSLDLFHGMYVGDFNGDSNPDVLFNDYVVKVYFGDGYGDFVPDHWSDPVSGRYGYITARLFPIYHLIYNDNTLFSSDFNRDGLADLVLIHPDTNLVSMLMGSSEAYTHDVGVLSILEPTGNVFIEDVIYPEAIVANFGAESESFQAYFHIGSVYSDTIDATLDIGQLDTISFNVWEPIETDDYQTVCGIILAGDENQSNNTKTGSVSVIDISGDIPYITNIRRNYGGDIGWITTQITGYNFETGADIRLIRDGLNDIIANAYQIESTTVISDTLIQAVFNLEGAERGDWHVVVTNPGENADTLLDGFTIEIGEEHLWLDIGGLSQVNLYHFIDIPLSYSLYAGNSGNNNLDRIILEITIANYLRIKSIVNSATGDTLLNTATIDSLYDSGVDSPTLPIYVSTIEPGETKIYVLNVETVLHNYSGKPGEPVVILAPDGIDFKGGALGALSCFGKSLYNSMIDHGNLTENDFRQAGEQALNNLGEGLLTSAVKIGVQILFPWTIPFIQAYDLATGLIGQAESARQLAEMFFVGMEILFGIFRDPNDKAGPVGYGDEGYINDGRILHYTIYFMNDSTISNMAVPIVEIFDTLDTDLDWRTLEFGESKHTLTSMNLDTILVNNDTTLAVSFLFDDINLPPNDNPPEGQSWFNYTIWPDSGLASGTQITNMAHIEFKDSFAVMDTLSTSLVLNTIDNQPPQSSMNQLPATMNSVAFRLSWSGSDDASGIFRYNVFYSKDGGGYQLWQNTADTSTIFIGKNGSTYGFCSVAIDHVGFTEARPDEPDVMTIIDADEDIGVSPNPFVPSRGHTTMTFFGGSLANSTIKIYNKAGRLVRTLEETSGESTLEWNGTNDDGEQLASGVYIWFLTGPAGEDKGKFAIIR